MPPPPPAVTWSRLVGPARCAIPAGRRDPLAVCRICAAGMAESETARMREEPARGKRGGRQAHAPRATIVFLGARSGHPVRHTIAIICDCDDTLAPNTTNFLLEHNGIDADGFWDRISSDFVGRGWDPPQAYLGELLRLMKEGKIRQDTPGRMRALGRKIRPHPGAATFIAELREWIAGDPEFAGAGVGLEGYVISSGIEDLVGGCAFAGQFAGTFGCNYSTGADGRYDSIKSTVTFTEKTKFLYAINKGIGKKSLRSRPYLVNSAVSRGRRRVPFGNMVYIGDGPSDIPCFSAVRSNGGHCIGIINKRKPRRAYELARGRRINYGIYSADYRPGGDLRLVLRTIITEIKNRIR